jgi:hypothetical protein
VISLTNCIKKPGINERVGYLVLGFIHYLISRKILILGLLVLALVGYNDGKYRKIIAPTYFLLLHSQSQWRLPLE